MEFYDISPIKGEDTNKKTCRDEDHPREISGQEKYLFDN